MGSDGTPDIVYEDNDLAVVVDEASSPQVVVTFSPLIGANGRAAITRTSGFGAKFLHESGVSAVHFVAKWNHWWQAPGAMEAVGRVCDRYGGRELWTYGASMGGSGALMFADRLGAAGVIALDPQASVSPERAKFDTRWTADRSKIVSFDDGWLDRPNTSLVNVFYDNADILDTEHVKLLRSAFPNMRECYVRYARHATTSALHEMGMLKSTVLAILGGTFDRETFQDELRLRRGESMTIVSGISAFLAERGRTARAVHASEMAIDVARRAPGESAARRRLVLEHGSLLLAAGQYDAARKFLSAQAAAPLSDADLREVELRLVVHEQDKDRTAFLLGELLRDRISDPAWQRWTISLMRNLLEQRHAAILHARYGAALLGSRYEREYREVLEKHRIDWRIENEVLVVRDSIGFLWGGHQGIPEYASGALKPRAESLRAFARNIRDRAQASSAGQRPFVHVIFPDKQSVLDDVFPLRPLVRLGEIYVHGLEYDLRDRVLYPVEELRATPGSYTPFDTHLSDLGSLTVLRLMLSRAGIEADDALDRIQSRIVRSRTWAGDLGSKLDPQPRQTALCVDPDWPLEQFFSGGGFNDGLVDILVNPQAPVEKTVLLFGDSFFRMMLVHLSGVFSRVVCLRTRYYHPEMVSLIRPDVVFSGNAERYLSNVDDDAQANAFMMYRPLKGVVEAMEEPFLSAWRSFTSPLATSSAKWFDRHGVPVRARLS